MIILQAYYSAGGINLLSLILIALLIWIVVYAIIKFNRTIDYVAHHDHQMFEGMQFSSQEFYDLIVGQVQAKQIPNVKIGRVTHSMRGMFSGKREYLRIVYQNYFFDICAAPFAKDFFVSYRQGTLKVLVRKKRAKTFYEEDTEAMFHASVKLCYERAIDHMMEKKGMRKTANDLTLLQ